MSGLTDDAGEQPATGSERLAHFGWTPGQALLIVLANGIQFVQAAGLLALLVVPWAGLGWRVGAGGLWLYVVPPVAARVLLRICPLAEGWLSLGSRAYIVWWYVLNLQVLFCRFPALEEALRVVPRLYSAWLRLWGARIGRFVYWAPGLRILDRSLLDIGDEVVFGAGVRLSSHVMARTGSGDLRLALGTIRVGRRAVVGGYSVLTAGTVVPEGECTRACLISPPFSTWRDGHRQKGTPA